QADGRHRRGVDDGHEPGAGGVTADDAVGEVAEVVDLLVPRPGHHVAQVVGQAGAVEQGGDGHQQHPEHGDQAVTGPGDDAPEGLVTGGQRVGKVVEEVLHPLVDAVAADGVADQGQRVEVADDLADLGPTSPSWFTARGTAS